jgi:hypothetical protein
MPAEQPSGVPHYSCSTYVSGLHSTVSYDTAVQLARGLDLSAYKRVYCGCYFCSGAIERDVHPLQLLVAVRTVRGPRGRPILVPAEAALASNTWHYLWSRRVEIESFRGREVQDVIAEAAETARQLNISPAKLLRLASHLKQAS